MKITLYNSSAEDIRLDKTNYLNPILNLEGTLRERCSLLQPSILLNIYDYDPIIESNNIEIVDSTPDDIIYAIVNRIIGCNYAYIPEFKRYYFVQDIISESRFLWRLNLSCDTLMSFKDEILSQEAMIARNENDYNSLLVDNQVSFENDKEITYEAVSNTADCKTFNVATSDDSTKNFVVSYISVPGNTSTYEHSSTADGSLPALERRKAGNTIVTNYAVLNFFYANYFAQQICLDSNKVSFVKSMVCLPYEPKYVNDTETDKTITLGNTVITLEDKIALGNDLPDPFVPARVKFADFTFLSEATSFTEQVPYSRYFLYIPYLGYKELESQYLGDRIQVFYAVSYDDGSATVFIYDKTLEQTIYVDTCQVGVLIGLSSTNAETIKNQKLSLGISTAIGSLTSLIAIAGGAFTGNPLSVAGGVVSLGGTIANAVSSNAQLRESGQVKITNGAQGVLSQQTFFLRIEKMNPVNESSITPFMGKPLYENRTLSNLTGYTQIADVHLENVPNATKSELQQIESLLKSGIII